MTIAISRRNLWLRSTLAAASVVATASGLVAACSSSSSGTTVTEEAGTAPDTGTSGKDSGKADTGTTEKDAGAKDTGAKDAGEAAVSSLYDRLGKHAGIRAAIDAIVAQELENADINSYFFFQAGAPGNGHPTADEIEECFTDFVGAAAGGPEKYPMTITADGGTSYKCRDLATIHKPLLISGGTFTTFLMIAGAELTALGVSADDVKTLAGALASTEADIVTKSLEDAGLELFPGDGGTTTLYERLGGHSGIRSAVNAIVGQELMNTDIASYFFFQAGAPKNGHPTADEIEECFTDLVGNAAGGPEAYPTTIASDGGMYKCRDLATIHQPLLISGGTFDEFVMIAATELATLNVSADDVATLGAALNSTKTDVVKASLADAGLEPFPGDGG
jgi:hypothetical protein